MMSFVKSRITIPQKENTNQHFTLILDEWVLLGPTCHNSTTITCYGKVISMHNSDYPQYSQAHNIMPVPYYTMLIWLTLNYSRQNNSIFKAKSSGYSKFYPHALVLWPSRDSAVNLEATSTTEHACEHHLTWLYWLIISTQLMHNWLYVYPDERMNA